MPDGWLVELSGIVNENCDDCGDLNGEYVIDQWDSPCCNGHWGFAPPYIPVGSRKCCRYYNFPSPICDVFKRIEIQLYYVRPTIWFTVSVLSRDSSVCSVDLGSGPVFRKTWYPDFIPCHELDQEDIPLGYDDMFNRCNASNATCLATTL